MYIYRLKYSCIYTGLNAQKWDWVGWTSERTSGMSVDDNIYLYERAFSRRESSHEGFSPGGWKGVGASWVKPSHVNGAHLHRHISHISVDMIFMKQLCKNNVLLCYKTPPHFWAKGRRHFYYCVTIHLVSVKGHHNFDNGNLSIN